MVKDGEQLATAGESWAFAFEPFQSGINDKCSTIVNMADVEKGCLQNNRQERPYFACHN